MTRKDANRPNLFIVGSMKCGTTILFDFLRSHEQITGGSEKESHYFSLYYDLDEEWYLENFPAAVRQKYVLDASPTYFDMCLSAPTAERIKDFSPDAKIIILIRNPVQRAISHFLHKKKINEITALQDVSFDDMVERRWENADDVDELESIRELLIDFSLYSKKIEKFVDIFGYDNVLAVNNDDLRNHGDIVVKQIFDFLGLDTPEGRDFSHQDYLNGSDAINVKPKNYFDFLTIFGDDYYRACRIVQVKRPNAPAGMPEFNQPIGGLVGEVGIGENGWLFLAVGSNCVVQMYTEPEHEQETVVEAWHQLVADRTRKLSALGSKYYHVMLPEKLTLLGDKLHWPIDTTRSRGLKFNHTAPTEVKNNIIDLIGYLIKLNNSETYFLKTDSHWNLYGAFIAYQLIFSTLNLHIRKDLLGRPRSMANIVLDLGSKLPDNPAEDVSFAQFREEAETVSDEGLVRYKRENGLLNEGSLHVGSYVEFKNPRAPNSQRVLLFGDSFSEYRDHLITALFAESFKHMAFIWSTSVDFSACERFRPDIVFCLMTERFMNRIPTDDFDFREHARLAIERRTSILQGKN